MKSSYHGLRYYYYFRDFSATYLSTGTFEAFIEVHASLTFLRMRAYITYDEKKTTYILYKLHHRD